MTFLDIVLGALLVFGMYKGIKNGLFVELASLVSFFIGIFIAIKFSSLVASALQSYVSWSPKTVQVAGFVLTILIVVIAIHQLAKVFTGIASFAYLGWLNKLGGAVFACLKTVLLLGIVLSLIQKVNINDALISKEKQEASYFFNPILKTSETLLPVLTDWFKELKVKATENLQKTS